MLNIDSLINEHILNLYFHSSSVTLMGIVGLRNKEDK